MALRLSKKDKMLCPLTGYQIGHLIWYILKSYFATQVMLVHILYSKLHSKLINLQSPKCEKRRREKTNKHFLSVQLKLFLTFSETPQPKSCYVSVDTTIFPSSLRQVKGEERSFRNCQSRLKNFHFCSR